MDVKSPVLQVENRSEHGKKVGRLRRAGILPAVLYGPGVEGQAVQVDAHAFARVYSGAGTSTLIDLQLPGTKKQVKALIREVQREPVFGKLLHVNFFAPNLLEKSEFEVPVVLGGDSPAVKNGTGVLLHGVAHIKVRCLPTEVPHELVVDVSRLAAVDDTIRVSDITMADGCEILIHGDELLARVVALRAEVPSEGAVEPRPPEVLGQPVQSAIPEVEPAQE